MDAIPPLVFEWTGEVMQPLTRFAKLADKHFVIGEDYTLVEHHERSSASHAQYFALVKDLWRTLPEEVGERFPTPDALRKHALIRAGFHHVSEFACMSAAEAQRTAAVISAISDDYCVVVVRRNAVRRLTAKSQSYASMDRETFQKSKEAVLQIIAGMIDEAEPQRVLEHAAA